MSEAAAAVEARPRHEYVRTTCGTEVTIGRLALGDDRYPVARVFVGMSDNPGHEQAAWEGLTVSEARELARELLSQAAAAEHDCGSEPGSAGRVTVSHVSGDAYAITTRGHSVLVDQPVADGGRDAAATPTELLVASLASCVAFYSGRYLTRHGLDRAGLTITAEFAMATDRPARVTSVRLGISAPGLPEQRKDALLAVASHCTVHNTLRQEPSVSIELA
jgi:putative redox protein